MLFVNLPVRDLAVSRAFFTALGFTFNNDFADETMETFALGADASVLLLTHDYFATFTDKAIADTATSAETILAIGVESRTRVDEIVEAAVANGGTAVGPTKDLGYVYTRGFADPDGHLWEATHFSGQ